MKLLPIALVLAGTTGLAGLTFAAGQTVTAKDLVMPDATVARDDLSSLRLADSSSDDHDDEDEGDDDSAAPFPPVICLAAIVNDDDDDDDEDEDEGEDTPVCDLAGQTAAGPSAVTPDPNRAPIFNSAPTAVVN